ncbi:MAG: hypothetical protein LAQ69_00880 [Acidobacteriia bacterium]|nr:hypothetical protein [Terriglobia bacterium]
MLWFDRAGKPLGTVGPPGDGSDPAISPDGATVAEDRSDPVAGTPYILLHDLVHGTDSRFTFDPKTDLSPVWSPDGSRILFCSNRTGERGLYQKPATGAGKEELLFETPTITVPTDWSRDGRVVNFQNAGVHTAFDVWVLPLSGDRKPFPFLQTAASERNGKLSPDGRWLAYESDQTGEYEVYVQTFPGKEGKWQVSAAGGTHPVWRRDGRELFFISGNGQLMAADVKSGATFGHSVPKPLFETETPLNAAFGVSQDGKRFLMDNLLEIGSIQSMNVIINWQAGAKQ